MYRFLLTRRWIVAAVVVLTAVVVMIQLGLWQLRRLDAVRAGNARVAARLALPAVAIEELPGVNADAAYRRVFAEGRYESTSEILVSNRSNEGRAGRHVLTPLRIRDGRALVVDRGWVPLGDVPAAAAPPEGTVRVEGVLFPSERRGALGAEVPAGRPTEVPRVDVEHVSARLTGPTYPLYLRLRLQMPGQVGPLPVPPDLPRLDDGPHLSYAVQWFIFATIATLTFGALARRAAGQRRGQS